MMYISCHWRASYPNIDLNTKSQFNNVIPSGHQIEGAAISMHPVYQILSQWKADKRQWNSGGHSIMEWMEAWQKHYALNQLWAVTKNGHQASDTITNPRNTQWSNHLISNISLTTFGVRCSLKIGVCTTLRCKRCCLNDFLNEQDSINSIKLDVK